MICFPPLYQRVQFYLRHESVVEGPVLLRELVEDARVHLRGEQVVGGRHRVDVTRQVQVEVLHRNHLIQLCLDIVGAHLFDLLLQIPTYYRISPWSRDIILKLSVLVHIPTLSIIYGRLFVGQKDRKGEGERESAKWRRLFKAK